MSRGKAAKAELVKDICAMANNGSIASYILVGVSDDGQSFESVSNAKLVDDNLQSFCKDAIFPPPRIRVHREHWARASSAHAGKDFVIIQIGPQARHIFRLARDFIEYSERVCYRRNEVWIRRGATSDLAAPEEIVRLASGESLERDPTRIQRQADQKSFSRLSQIEQITSITSTGEGCVEELDFVRLPEKDWFHRYWHSRRRSYPTYWKRSARTIVIVCVLPCTNSLTKRNLEELSNSGIYDWNFVLWNSLPDSITSLTRRRVHAIRRIWLNFVIGSVPDRRVASVFPTL